MRKYLFLVSSLLLINYNIYSQNPIIRNQFTADPSARVFNGKVYVFPSHDIPAPEGKNLRKDWFCMEDYHVFSSDNLVDWVDHGVIVSQYNVPWADSNAYSMWAPDCIERNGKYYFYFPAISKPDSAGRKLFSIGVAIADKPEGPYTPLPEPIKGVRGIDPNVFIDKDGQAYLYWSLRHIYVAKLKDNMIELDSEPQIISNLPEKGLKEGPWVFKRNGIYYLTFPHVENERERLEYAMGPHPMGPFKMAGVIMDESPTCWTNHHSIIEYKGQWYLFYHLNYLSPHFDKNRSACIDSLFFNEDGTIRKVRPTYRGVGITNASKKIEIDRYSEISEEGVEVVYLDTSNTFKGWKAVFTKKGAWLQYNSVDFGKGGFSTVVANVYSEKGGLLEIKLDNMKNNPIAKVTIPPSKGWQIVKSRVTGIEQGIHNIIVVSRKNEEVEIDWLFFE
ncbi:MAG: family 43 glycosylhydrolase [Melioribacteraceae bacterium]